MPVDFPAGGYIRRMPDRTPSVRVFLSSGSDLLEERDLLDRLAAAAEDGLSGSAWGEASHPTIRIQRWEDTVARRTNGDTNAQFVQMARASHITIVLVKKDLRGGTEEEVRAVVSDTSIQVSVLWLRPATGVTRKLRTFLKEHQDQFYYEQFAAESDGLLVAFTRILAALVSDFVYYSVSRPDVEGEVFSEYR